MIYTLETLLHFHTGHHNHSFCRCKATGNVRDVAVSVCQGTPSKRFLWKTRIAFYSPPLPIENVQFTSRIGLRTYDPYRHWRYSTNAFEQELVWNLCISDWWSIGDICHQSRRRVNMANSTVNPCHCKIAWQVITWLGYASLKIRVTLQLAYQSQTGMLTISHWIDWTCTLGFTHWLLANGLTFPLTEYMSLVTMSTIWTQCKEIEQFTLECYQTQHIVYQKSDLL